MTPSRFISRLEALRGVAAVMVALTHAMGGIKLLTEEAQWIKRAIAVFGNGGAGVTIFFILSGYVLGLSLMRMDTHPLRDWPAFIFRRVLRIYPAMTACLLFIWFYVANVYHYATYEAATVAMWAVGADAAEFLRNMVFTSNYLNMVTWTLQVEMFGSLLFPLMFWLKTRHRNLALLVLVAWMAFFAFTPLYAWWRVGFLYMFLLGLFVSDLDDFMARHLHARWARPLVAAIAFAVCCSANFIWTEAFAYCWMLYSVSAWVLVAALAGIPREQRIWVLDWRATRYMGRISYSFYLWHLPILVIIGSFVLARVDNAVLLAYPITSMLLLFLVSGAVTVVVAHFSHKFLELPFKGGGVGLRAAMGALGRRGNQAA